MTVASSPTDWSEGDQEHRTIPDRRRVRGNDPPPAWYPDLEAVFAQVSTYEEARRRAVERRAVATWVAVEQRRTSTRWLGRRVGLSNQRVGQLVADGAAIVAREGWSAEEAEARVGMGR